MSPIRSRKHLRNPLLFASPLSLATLLAGGLLALPASAQDAHDAVNAAGGSGGASDQAEALDHISVVAQRLKYGPSDLSSPKFTQPLVDTTRTVSVIGSDLFNEQGATSLVEALRNSPGVGTFYAGENGSTSTGDTVYMRGFDASSSIFVDGVRDLGSVSRDVFNIQQVEVLKGPAGADFGRSSPTGAINMVSKQPRMEDAVDGSVSFGNADQKRATADVNHALSDHSAFRVNVLAQDGGVAGRDEVRNKRWGIAPTLAFGLGTSTRVYLDYLHVRQDNIPDGFVPTIGLPGFSSPDPARPWLSDAPPVDSSNFYGTASDHDDQTIDMATVRVEHAFSDGARLQNTTRWGRNQQDFLLTSFTTTEANWVTPDPDDRSTWTIARSNPNFKDQRNTIVTNQTNFGLHSGEVGGMQNDLSAGVEVSRETLLTHGQAALDGSTWPAANLYRPDASASSPAYGRNGAHGRARTDTAALYAFDTLAFNARWQANAGVRLDRYRTALDAIAVCSATRSPLCGALPAGSLVPNNARARDTLFNWNVGLLYKPAANGSLYANYATSQQPPGGATLELSTASNNANNPIFDPQKARTAEAGTKWEFSDGRLLLAAALYDTRIGNEVIVDPTDDSAYLQAGEKRVRGVELGAIGRITDAWSLSAGYTTMDTSVAAGPAVTADGSGNLAYTPRNAFTSWSTYDAGNGLTFGGGARYNGGLHRGTDRAIGTPASTDGYWVVDAVATYAFSPKFGLRLNVYNLFDRDYVAAINKSGYRYVPGVRRSVLLSADFHF
jgi:catecholate siderophore receptor